MKLDNLLNLALILVFSTVVFGLGYIARRDMEDRPKEERVANSTSTSVWKWNSGFYVELKPVTDGKSMQWRAPGKSLDADPPDSKSYRLTFANEDFPNDSIHLSTNSDELYAISADASVFLTGTSTKGHIGVNFHEARRERTRITVPTVYEVEFNKESSYGRHNFFIRLTPVEGQPLKLEWASRN